MGTDTRVHGTHRTAPNPTCGCLVAGLRSLEVAIQESDGAADDGVVEAGGTFSVYCSVPEIRAGNVVVWSVLPSERSEQTPTKFSFVRQKTYLQTQKHLKSRVCFF